MNLTKKQLMIAGTLLIIIFLAVFFVFRGKGNQKQELANLEPTETVIPTVDSSVQVNLTSTSAGKEVVLDIQGIPTGTESIDYELSYQTRQQGLQGVIGTLAIQNESGYEKRITLGTCSSGKCVYHEVVGKIKLTLKFTGSYGDKVFEKEVSL